MSHDEQTPGERMDQRERHVLLALIQDPFPWTVSVSVKHRAAHAGLTSLCGQYELDIPDKATVAETLDELVHSYDSKELYPAGRPSTGEELRVVRASRVLAEMWWKLIEVEYDKVETVNGLRAHRSRLAAAL